MLPNGRTVQRELPAGGPSLTFSSQIPQGVLTTYRRLHAKLIVMKITVFALFALVTIAPAADVVNDRFRNPLIEYQKFQRIAAQVAPVRESRRITEDQFAAMAAEPGTVILDARSADKYALRHVKGAVNLPFTDFTADSLARVIPAKETRVLIYCNNNFLGAPISLRTKSGPASLNISTYISLATYGYTNIYELGPLLHVQTTKLTFVGSELQAGK